MLMGLRKRRDKEEERQDRYDGRNPSSLPQSARADATKTFPRADEDQPE
jgi:hypothetical protein